MKQSVMMTNLIPKHGLWICRRLREMKLDSQFGCFERMQKPAVLFGKTIITGAGGGKKKVRDESLEMDGALLKRKA